MKLNLDEKDERFREHVRRRIAELLPSDIQERERRIMTSASLAEDQRCWFAILDQEGWSVPAWPVQYGGTGWTALQRFIFEEELYAANAPEFNWMGSHMVGPVLYTFGSAEQKERFLPKIRNGEHIWAQGFSEPGAGSDLAGLRTNATLRGDHYVVNGQKIWTSGAADADWGFFLVKTDLAGKPQESISILLIDLKTPGVAIRKIPQLNGDAHLCEVFLDDVEAPVDQLIGTPGKGWTYAKFLLDHERTTSAYIYWLLREMKRTKDLARVIDKGGRPLIKDPLWSTRIAKLEAAITAHQWSVLRVLANEKFGTSTTAAASVLKLKGAELQQSVTQLQADLLGLRALRDFDVEIIDHPSDDRWPEIVPGRTSRALMARAATIYGGTQQIQKNILAKIALGL